MVDQVRYSPNEGRIIVIKKRSRHHDEQIHLTEEERYYASYATGYRIGKLQFVKKCLLNLLKKTELPSKLSSILYLQLRSEINLETDAEILFKLLINLTKPETIKGITDIHSVWSMALRSEAEVLAEEYSAYEVSDDD